MKKPLPRDRVELRREASWAFVVLRGSKVLALSPGYKTEYAARNAALELLNVCHDIIADWGSPLPAIINMEAWADRPARKVVARKKPGPKPRPKLRVITAKSMRERMTVPARVRPLRIVKGKP